MRRSSKYAALALLISTVGPAALQAAEGAAHHRVAYPRNTREADRKARIIARRMKELLDAAARA